MSAQADKDYLRVLRLIVGGAETAREVADEMGIDASVVCAHLCNLAKQGLAARVGWFWAYDSGRKFLRWRPTDAGRAAA